MGLGTAALIPLYKLKSRNNAIMFFYVIAVPQCICRLAEKLIWLKD